MPWTTDSSNALPAPGEARRPRFRVIERGRAGHAASVARKAIALVCLLAGMFGGLTLIARREHASEGDGDAPDRGSGLRAHGFFLSGVAGCADHSDLMQACLTRESRAAWQVEKELFRGHYLTKWLSIGLKADTLNQMVEQSLDRVFHALADPTRRAILDRLREGEATVGRLSEPFPLSFAAVSKHLGVLERAGLVTREARGRARMCRVNPGALNDARAWLEIHERFWSERLDALDQLVGSSPDTRDR